MANNRKPKIKQTNESTLKMLWSLHNKIGQNTRFAMGTFLKSKTFNSDGYVTALIGAGIVKNVGYKTQGQDWRWIGGEPNITMVENFLRYFRTKGKDYNDTRDEKVHREEIKAVNANTGGLDFDKPEKYHTVSIINSPENEKEVFERWGQKQKYDKTVGHFDDVAEPIEKTCDEYGREKEKGILEHFKNNSFSEPQQHGGVVTPNTAKADTPKIVEKTKLVYKYQLRIADGNLAFQFAFLWGLIKINFVYRGKGAQ